MIAVHLDWSCCRLKAVPSGRFGLVPIKAVPTALSLSRFRDQAGRHGPAGVSDDGRQEAEEQAQVGPVHLVD